MHEQAALLVDLAKKLQDRDLPKSGTPKPPDPSMPPANEQPCGACATLGGVVAEELLWLP